MNFKKSLNFLLILILIAIVSCGNERSDRIRVNKIIKEFTPPEQEFRINPFKENIITGNKGTRLIIPPKAFDLDYDDLKKNDRVTIQLIEVVDILDFIASGVSLQYNEEGEDMLFESAGMYKVTAKYKDDELKLARNKKIEVQFPNIVEGEKFNMYKMSSSGEWVYDGHNQAMLEKNCEGNLTEKMEIVFTRIYEISELTWWNIDYPRKDIACIKGSITLNQKKLFQVISLGISTKGYFSRWIKGNEFITIALLHTKIKIIIITEDGRIGFSDAFETGDRWGHFKTDEGPHNYCKDLGEIKIKKVSKQILKNREKFLNYIGLKDEKYRVKYPTSLKR